MKRFSFPRFTFTLQHYLLYMAVGGMILTCLVTIYRDNLYENRFKTNRTYRAKQWLADSDTWLKHPEKTPSNLSESNVRIIRAGAYVLLERYDEAIEEFEKGRKIADDTFRYDYQIPKLIEMFERHQRYKDVAHIYEALLKDYPDQLEFARSYAFFLLEARDPAVRDPEKAARVAEEYIKNLTFYPGREEYRLQATIYLETGKLDEAERSARKALTFPPTLARGEEDENQQINDLLAEIHNRKKQRP